MKKIKHREIYWADLVKMAQDETKKPEKPVKVVKSTKKKGK